MTEPGTTESAAGPERAGASETGERAIASLSPPLRPLAGSGMDGRLVIGPGSGLDSLDPFPALMHDDVPPQVMFPMHQHRGVEIITYALGGALHHEDSLGNEGTVVAGGIERNLFGRGFAHSEAPVGGAPYRGLQLFTALSPEDRSLEPSFQLLTPDEVPEVVPELESPDVAPETGVDAVPAPSRDARVRVVAGEYGGATSPLVLRRPTLYLDVQLPPGAALTLPVPAALRGLVYVIQGAGRFGTPATEAGTHQRLVLGPGASLRVAATAGAETLRFVLISAVPDSSRLT